MSDSISRNRASPNNTPEKLEQHRKDVAQYRKKSWIGRLFARLLGIGGKIESIDRANVKSLKDRVKTELTAELPEPKTLEKIRTMRNKERNANSPDSKHKGKERKAAKALAKLNGALRCVESLKDQDLPALKSGDETEWIALGETKKGDSILTEGKVLPTAARALPPDDDAHSDGLYNIYYNISSDGHINITCSAIVTQHKADQFIAAVKEAIKARSKMKAPAGGWPPVRISLLQVNAIGIEAGRKNIGERDMIIAERKLAYYIENKLKWDKEIFLEGAPKGRIIAHKNICYNSFSGDALQKGELTMGSLLNLEHEAIELSWALEELGGFADELKGLNGLLVTLSNAHQEVAAFEGIAQFLNPDKQSLGNKIEQSQKSDYTKQVAILKANREELKKLMEGLRKRLEDGLDLQHVRTPGCNALEPTESKTTLRKITAILTKAQLDPSYARKFRQAQLIALNQIRQKMLGVVSELNCKSGLDRTGDVRSLTKACDIYLQELAGENPPTEEHWATLVDFICTYQTRRKKMDKALKKIHKLNIKDKSFSFDNWINSPKGGAQWLDLHHFQVLRWNEHMNVGLEVTRRSTGITGFKWHNVKRQSKGFFKRLFARLEKNPHPTQWIPYEVKDGEQTHQLVDWSKRGKRKLTKDAITLLEGASQLRGG